MPHPIPIDLPVSIVLARDFLSASVIPVSRPTVAIVAKNTDWNDFTFRFGAHFYVIPEIGDPVALPAKFMFAGSPNTARTIAQLLTPLLWMDILEVQTPFCSVLEDIDSYNIIVRLLGFEKAVSALRKLGDAVVLNLEGNNQEKLSLVDSDEFYLGALRHEGTFVAFRRGSRFLRPQPLGEIDDSAVSFSVQTTLPSANNVYDVRFDFDVDNLDRNRISVLIGRNGTGKTQLLLSLINGLQEGSDTNPLTHPIVFNPKPTSNRLIVFSSVASDQYPRSIPPWAGIDYQYFSMISGDGSGGDTLTASLIDCIRDDNRIQFVAQSDETFPIPTRSTGRMAMLERALETLGLSSPIYLPLRSDIIEPDLPDIVPSGGRLYFPLSRASSLNEQRRVRLVRLVKWGDPPVVFGLGPKARSLSSGELAMLRFAAQASGSAEKGCIFLFDEPETHLHPNFVSDFMSILHVILEASKSVAIIVTHSAYIVREVPRKRVRILSLEGRTVSIDQPRLQTFGASIDSISEFVFEDTNVSHQYQATLQKWVDRLEPNISIEEVVERYGSDMNSETLSFVAQIIRSRPQ